MLSSIVFPPTDIAADMFPRFRAKSAEETDMLFDTLLRYKFAVATNYDRLNIQTLINFL